MLLIVTSASVSVQSKLHHQNVVLLLRVAAATHCRCSTLLSEVFTQECAHTLEAAALTGPCPPASPLMLRSGSKHERDGG